MTNKAFDFLMNLSIKIGIKLKELGIAIVWVTYNVYYYIYFLLFGPFLERCEAGARLWCVFRDRRLSGKDCRERQLINCSTENNIRLERKAKKAMANLQSSFP